MNELGSMTWIQKQFGNSGHTEHEKNIFYFINVIMFNDWILLYSIALNYQSKLRKKKEKITMII